MNETRDLLERVGERFAFPEDAFDRLEDRRDTRRRNRRLAAGIAGMAIFAAFVFALARASSTGSAPAPADPDPVPSPSVETGPLTPIVRSDESFVQTNRGIEAVDRSTGAERTLVRCGDPCVFIENFAVSP